MSATNDRPAPVAMPAEKAKPVATLVDMTEDDEHSPYDRYQIGRTNDGYDGLHIPVVLASDYDALWLACEEARREVERLKRDIRQYAAGSDEWSVTAARLAKEADAEKARADGLAAEVERLTREKADMVSRYCHHERRGDQAILDLREMTKARDHFDAECSRLKGDVFYAERTTNEQKARAEAAEARLALIERYIPEALQRATTAASPPAAGEKAWGATWELKRMADDDLSIYQGSAIVGRAVAGCVGYDCLNRLLGSSNSVKLAVRVLPDGEG
jgi:DNA repair exonuclease SbcCD ATPase subunit